MQRIGGGWGLWAVVVVFVMGMVMVMVVVMIVVVIMTVIMIVRGHVGVVEVKTLADGVCKAQG